MSSAEQSPAAPVAIIGTGRVGAALGKRFASAGYPVRFGVRGDKDLSELLDQVRATAGGVSVEAKSPMEAAREAELIFLAVPGGALFDAVSSLGSLMGKVLVDCTNPVRWDKGPVWDPPEAGSNAQALQALAQPAVVVKAFNGFGAEFHEDPELGGRGIDVFMAGDDEGAKARVAEIALRSGFCPVDAGPLRNAGLVENAAVLWIHLAMVGGQGRDFGLCLVRREG